MQLFKKSQKLIWAFTAVALLAVVPVPALAGKSQPLPDVEKITTGLKTADDAVEMMFVSSDIKIPDNLKSKLTSQVDVLKVEIDAMWDLINDKSVPNSEKEITYVRYTMGDKRVDEALIAALKAGIKVRILTDVNPVMEYDKFQKGEKSTIDFAGAKLKNNGKGSGPETIARLLAGGFVWGENLFSQPLYNPTENERTPIMHEKALLIRLGKKLTSFLSTTNAAPHVRFNRIFKIILDGLYNAYHDHTDSLIANYKAGKETKELPSATRKQFDFADGTFLQLAFTDGKFNPNDRIVDAVNAGDLKGWVISAFAPTNRAVIDAIGNKMKADKDIKGFAITDVKFTNDYGYGVTSALSNYNVYAQFVTQHGFGEAVASQVDAAVWTQQAMDPDTGKPIYQTEEDGAPNYAVLWHDKTTILYYKALGMIDVFSGSFNLSGNIVNAENQLQMRLRADSIVAAATDYSIRETVRTNPKYAIPITVSMVRSTLAKTFKLGDLDVQEQDVKDLIQAVKDQHHDAVLALLEKISQSETHMKAPISKEERANRVATFGKFLGWYFKDLPQWSDPIIGLKHTLAIGLAIANEKMPVGMRISIIKDAVWRPKVSPEDLQKYLEQGYEVLGYGKLPPPPAPRTGDDRKKKTQDEPLDKNDNHGDINAGTISPADAHHDASDAAAHAALLASTDVTSLVHGDAPADQPSLSSGIIGSIKARFHQLVAPTTTVYNTAPIAPAPVAAHQSPIAPQDSKPTFPTLPALKPAPAPAAPAPIVAAPPAAQPIVVAPAPVQAPAPFAIEGIRDLRPLNGIKRTDAVFFDFDNTVANLPTKIRLFKKGSNDFIDLGSDEYALAKPSIGLANSKFANYEIRKGGAGKEDSFVHFENGDFPTDVRNALVSFGITKAAGFDSLVERLRYRDSAARTYFDTARGHEPKVFMKGLQIIKAFVKKTQGIELFLPNISHLIEVGYASSVPDEKAKRIIALIPKLKKMGAKQVVLLDDDANNVSATNLAGRSALNKKALMGLKLSAIQILPTGPVYNVIVPAKSVAPRVLLCKDLFH